MEAACRPTTELMAKKLALPLVFMLLLVLPGVTANSPGAGESEFVFARLRYGGGRGGFRFGGSWATDAPASDHKFMFGIKKTLQHQRQSGIQPDRDHGPHAV